MTGFVVQGHILLGSVLISCWLWNIRELPWYWYTTMFINNIVYKLIILIIIIIIILIYIKITEQVLLLNIHIHFSTWYFLSDILRSLLLQCTVCKWAQHFSQSASPNPWVQGHEWQPGLVAGGGRRKEGIRPIQLHPQIWVHMSCTFKQEQSPTTPDHYRQTHYGENTTKGHYCALTIEEMHWCGERVIATDGKNNTLHIDYS